MRAENDGMREAMEEALTLVSGMNEQMTDFIRVHEVSVAEYEGRLASLKHVEEGRNRMEEEPKREMRRLEEENVILRAAILEDSCNIGIRDSDRSCEAERYYKEKCKEKLRKLTAEREEAYRTCEVLQREVEMLHARLSEKERNGGDEQEIEDMRNSLAVVTSRHENW